MKIFFIKLQQIGIFLTQKYKLQSVNGDLKIVLVI